MRLVTVNLYNGRVVPRDLARFLDETSPRVLCAQEVGPDAGRILELRFPYGRVEPSMHVDGRAMVADVPIDVVPLDLAFRGGLRGTVVMEGRHLDIISIHLANPVDGVSGLRARRSQLDDLERELRAMGPGVLVGDLNATPAWPAYKRIRRHLSDGVDDWARRNDTRPEPTWFQFPRWPAVLRIDHVFTRDVEVSSARTGRIAGLDHRAVITDLRWPQPAESAE